MRLTSHTLLTAALTLCVAACSRDVGVSVNERPPLGGVRFINAVPDGGPVDIRMVDQVEWSASSVNGTNVGLAFRAGTIQWATEAKARHLRVFPTDTSLAVSSQILLDTTITVEANKNVTLLLVGSRAAGGKVSFVTIADNPTPSSSQVAVRLVNATTAPAAVTADGYITTSTTSAKPATADFGAVAPLSASPYVMRAPASFAIQTSASGSTTTMAAAAAPDGADATAVGGISAGAKGPGSGLSAYLFPRSVAGTKAPQTAAFQSPGVVFFVDLIPKPSA